MARGDKYYRGTGKVWIDGIHYMDVYKASMTRKDDYEEIPDPQGYGKIPVFTGYGIEGSVTIRKSGNMPILTMLKNKKSAYEFDMIIKEQNLQTGDFETVKYKDCVIQEFPLSDFENRKITELDFSIKARDYEVLV